MCERSSISRSRSYREIGEFWDTHDLVDYWDQTESVEFQVDIYRDERTIVVAHAHKRDERAGRLRR